jgi:hypothetical protein
MMQVTADDIIHVPRMRDSFVSAARTMLVS